jgi:hypothetical protein
MSIETEGRVDCLAWYGELMDISARPEEGRDLYLRVDKTELGTDLLSRKGLINST